MAHGCSVPPYRSPTPYHRIPDITEPSAPSFTPERSPIVIDIEQRANLMIRNGQLDSAAQALERGLRIEPKDASLWSTLAGVRLRQSYFGQAISLATKSNSLAGGNVALIQRNEAIIETAQKAQNNW